MSEPGPAGGSNPLQGLPFFAELARVPAGVGPVHWDVARRVSVWVAGGGRPEPPVEGAVVAQLASLGRVAELAVADATGLPTSPPERPLAVVAVTRSEWALRALDAHRELLEGLAVSLSAQRPPDADLRPAGLAPDVLEGLVFGWMMGQLARRSLGQYDPPLPRPPTARVSVAAANLDEVATDWSLPAEEVRLWACVQDVAHHAVLGLPHVRHAVAVLLRRYVSTFEVAPDDLAAELDELEDLDPGDPAALRATLGDPEAVVAAVQTPAQAELVAGIEGLAAVVEGWVDHVVQTIGARLLPSYGSLQEVVRRRRAEASWGDRYVARLLGMGLRPSAYERGRSFVHGVVERGGEEALARLWASERELPTPAEVDAPGLWLARIDLPDDGG